MAAYGAEVGRAAGLLPPGVHQIAPMSDEQFVQHLTGVEARDLLRCEWASQQAATEEGAEVQGCARPSIKKQ
eukprot:126838-Pyramimonas_sp.AAC.1